MFVYDGTPIGDPNIFRWHPGTRSPAMPITWQGVLRAVSDRDDRLRNDFGRQAAAGRRMRASNIGGVLGAFLRSLNDALGAKITRKRTLGKFLDAVNFPGGNPNADPNTHFPDETFFISRKVSENPIFLEIELAVPFDVAGVQMPWRQVIAGTCQWVYRGPDCGYAGGAGPQRPGLSGPD